MPTIPPPASLPPPPPDQAVPRRQRLGTALGAALGASTLAAGPAALRLAGATETGAAWVALVALTLAPMFVAVLVLRQARVSVAAFGGSRAHLRIGALALWLGASFAILAVLGAVLRATTHHHPLAGVTFALLGMLAGIGLVPVCLRVSAIVQRSTTSRAGLFVLFAVSLLVPLLLMQRARAGLAPSSSATCVDLLAFGMAALFASRPALAGRRRLALSGPPLALLAFALGLYQIFAAHPPLDLLNERAPAFACLAELLVRH